MPHFWSRLFGKRDVFSAIEANDLQSLKELLRGVATDTLRQANAEGLMPLHFAARKGRAEAARMMIAASADIETRDAGEATPLHWAAIGGDVRTIETLLDAGADIHALDGHSLTPSRLAEMRGRKEAAELLRDRGG